MKSLNIVLFALFTVLFFSACNKGDDPTVVRVHKEDFTEEDQNKIGNVTHDYIISDESDFQQLSKDQYAGIYQYLDNLLQSLINTTLVETRDAYDWEVTVLVNDNIRTAFSAPGGKIYIYTGLLKFMQAENELVSVLAHEINYVESGMVMTYLAQKYSDEPYFLGDILLGNEVDGMNVLGRYLENLSYPEAEVIVADEFAMSLICPFQYNAMGMKTVLDNAAQSIDEIKWLNTRPSAANRIDKIVLAAEDCGDEEDPVFAERYMQYQAQLP